MTINIPQLVFDKYNTIADFMLNNDNFSRVCTLVYPPIKEYCTTCVGLAGTTNPNSFQGGNPAPFSFNSCEWCGGQGYREKITTAEIRLRIFWRPRDWIKIGNIVVPDAQCQVIGKISDLPALTAAQYISLASQETAMENNFKLLGKPALHGFGRTRYFVAYLEDS